jgi:hypothetical protein
LESDISLQNFESGEFLDSVRFIGDVEKELVPISPILEFAIKKQLADIGANKEHLSAGQAIQFIDRMTEALDLFLGAAEAKKARKMMVSALRKSAPEYFEEHSLI